MTLAEQPLGSIDMVAVCAAGDRLINQLTDPERRARLVQEILSHLLTCATSEAAPTNTSMGALALMVLALVHVAEGRPLHISDELLDAWETQPVCEVSECPGCGYRMPRRYETCVLCGSATGEAGVYAQRRARASAWN